MEIQFLNHISKNLKLNFELVPFCNNEQKGHNSFAFFACFITCYRKKLNNKELFVVVHLFFKIERQKNYLLCVFFKDFRHLFSFLIFMINKLQLVG